MNVAGDFVTAIEVAVIIVIRHLIEIYAAAKSIAQLLRMLPFGLVTIVMFAASVVWHPSAFNLAAIIRLQIAELAVQLHAAAGDDAGRQRGVVIGGQVEIIR